MTRTPTELICDHCRRNGLPKPALEYRFVTFRDWRFDLAFIEQKLAVEIQGGNFGGKLCPACKRRPGGRHNSPEAMREEYEKLAHAAIRGWRVIVLMPEQVRPETGLSWIERALTGI
jgi:hypothetical protein